MRLFTEGEIRYLEADCMKALGPEDPTLMTRAGRALGEKCLEIGPGLDTPMKVLVVCGKGGNGGDGLVAAGFLQEKGHSVTVFLMSAVEALRGECTRHYQALFNRGGRILPLVTPEDLAFFKTEMKTHDLLVDAIFGIGFKGEMKAFDEAVIRIVNGFEGRILSADIPSGIGADTGRVGGTAVRADFTLTFGFAKVGLFLEPGKSHVGELSVFDLGLKPEKDKKGEVLEVITPQWCVRALPQRSPVAHKGDFGHVLVIGGQRGMPGAVVMAAEAALLSGAGLVSIAAPEGLHDIIAMKLTEVMQHPLPQAQGGHVNPVAVKEVLVALQKATVVALGPGMGTASETVAFVKLILPQIKVPLVVDADGLNCISEILKEEENFFSRLKMPLVVTPHPGELSRLTGLSVEDLESHRVANARTYAKAWGVTLVSKGAATLVAEGERVHLNPTGNSGMATGGSGDVLTGIISGLLAQGMAPFEAASLAVYLHGRAGDLALLDKGSYSLRAGDLLAYLPKAFCSLKNPEEIPGFEKRSTD